MLHELQAQTIPGRRLIALAEELAADFATRADRHDRDGSYPFENIDALREAGYLSAPIPAAFGGLGVDSNHDLLVASSRLARGDASVTIGVNMHLAVLRNITRVWEIACAREDERRAAGLATLMAQVATSGAVICASVSEPDQELVRPRTSATRDGDSWLINGVKIFATMSPAATHLNVGLTFAGDDGNERYGFALVPKASPGVTLHDDWDALGMRASGSGSISFKDVRVPATALRDGFPAGRWSEAFIERFLFSGPAHASASLGIAEAAHAATVATVSTRRKGRSGIRLAERPMMQIATAENVIDLAVARAAFARSASQIDEYYAARPAGSGSLDELHALMAEVQAAKAFVHRAAIRIVDRAMTMTGGGAFMNKHRLARLYRDVRAGPFMHPMADATVYEYIAQVTLGLEPVAA